MSYRTFVIANPQSGAGQVRREWDRIERLIRAQIPEFEAAFTEGPEHATLLAREAIRAGWEMVVAVGGDGTINEVVNGFFEKVDATRDFEFDDGFIKRREGVTHEPIGSDAIFGFIPMGTGGDFRRTIGVMGGVAESVNLLAGKPTRACDIGQVTFVGHDGQLTSKFYANIASGGLAGLVDETANKMWKGLGGKMSFSIASLVSWVKYKNSEMDVILDGVDEFEGRFQNVIVANGEYFGGGMWIAPGAEVDDGLFQVILVGDVGTVESVQFMQKIYSAEHLDLPSVTRRNAREVAIRSGEKKPILIDMDGEQPGKLPALFEMHEHAIRLKRA